MVSYATSYPSVQFVMHGTPSGGLGDKCDIAPPPCFLIPITPPSSQPATMSDNTFKSFAVLGAGRVGMPLARVSRISEELVPL